MESGKQARYQPRKPAAVKKGPTMERFAILAGATPGIGMNLKSDMAAVRSR
jgi:hypothetical protein